MRKTLFTLFFLFISQIHQAQNKLDSLFVVWQDQTQSDSTRVDAYYKYILSGFLYSDPDTASILADELMAFGKSTNYLKAEASGLNLKGLSSWIKGDYPQALGYQSQSIKIKEQLGDQKGIAGSLINMGNIYNVQGDYPKALNYYQRGLKICEEIGEEKFQANALNNIGLIYSAQGDNSKTLTYYDQSLKILEKLGDKKGMAMALINIAGTLSTNKDDYPQALEYCQRGLKISEEIGEKQYQANALSTIGNIYKDQGNNPKALEFFTQSLKIQEHIGDKKGMATSLIRFGNIYKDQGDYLKALDYCKKGYEVALSIHLLGNQKSACECLYNTYKAMGKGNEALVYLEKMRIAEDSLNAEETAKKLEQMEFAKIMLQDSITKAEEARLIQEAHEKEVARKDRAKNIGFGLGGLVLLFAAGLYSRLRFVRKSKAIIEKEKDRSENLLLNILPEEIAQELKEKGKAAARNFEMVSILFTDFKDFTQTSEKLSAEELVHEINHCFEAFDHIIEKYNVEKIKTIGDAYMAAGGLPVQTNDSVKNTVLAALEMQAFVTHRKKELDASGIPAFEMRVGIHTGPVVAGIVGVKKFQYDIWGDTVNTASRIESSGAVGKVNISQSTYEILKNDANFKFENRGKVQAKGKGEIEMYFISKI